MVTIHRGNCFYNAFSTATTMIFQKSIISNVIIITIAQHLDCSLSYNNNYTDYNNLIIYSI